MLLWVLCTHIQQTALFHLVVHPNDINSLQDEDDEPMFIKKLNIAMCEVFHCRYIVFSYVLSNEIIEKGARPLYLYLSDSVLENTLESK